MVKRPATRSDPFDNRPVMILWKGQMVLDKTDVFGVCDADCYADKRTPAQECRCICRGNLHGTGTRRAKRLVRFQAVRWAEDYMRDKEIRNCTLQIMPMGGKTEWHPID